MDNNDNKQKLEAILKKYDANIRELYRGITRLEGNVTLKKNERKGQIKDLIVKEVTNHVN
ncbi:hypothetical protein [Acetobacterium sp.]|uniref:hypothetical protein n=1 Tax=Acetobacterium sp. TaxID=1872094 RepID=UPI002F3E90ED